MQEIRAYDISGCFRSKHELYSYLLEACKSPTNVINILCGLMYLPSIDNIGKEFVR